MAVASYRIALGMWCMVGATFQSSAHGQISDGFSSPGDAVSLLVYKPVQDELKLSEGQLKSAGELNQEFRESLTKLYADELQDNELRKARRESTQRANAKGVELLTPAQRERLMQISLQVREDVMRFSLADADFFSEDMSKALEISKEQASKIREVVATNEKARKEVRQRLRSLRFKSKEEQRDYIHEQVGALAHKRLIDVLTPEQQTALKRLRGPDFEYSLDDLPI